MPQPEQIPTNDTETAVDRLIDAIRIKLLDSLPQITAASHASGQPSSTTLKMALKPVKDSPDIWYFELTEKLTLASMPIGATARLSPGERGTQLSLMTFFDEV